MESRESRRLFPGGEPLVGWDLCLMNYPSRRGIRLNLKRVGGREGSSGKLIQTTHCPPSRLSFSSSSFFLPPLSVLTTTLRLLLVPPRKAKTRSLATDATRGGRGVPSYFATLPLRIPPIKMPRGARINLECTSIPSNVKPDTP